MKLVIVESPAKAKTINRYLGNDYKVAASMGHVMDLPKSKLRVDIENNYKPDYQIIESKKDLVKKLSKLVPRGGKEVYLAMDPDREGEAIAAHVSKVLNLKEPKRVIFHEITKQAVLTAIADPHKIDKKLVDAQKARRVLDRLVGYKLSELLWKKIWYGLSAGRVQSVAIRLVVEREREREAFKPDEFWNIIAHLLSVKKQKFCASLAKKNDKKFVSKSEKETKVVLSDLKGAKWVVGDVTKSKKRQWPSPPFTTVSLQQAAHNCFGYTARRTMQLAQQLYQGVTVKGKGSIGLITYMRTDSTYLANQAVKSMRSLIKAEYGAKYLPEKPTFFKTKSKLAQEAHEAIRPSHFNLDPESVKSSLKPQQYKLYKLIWDRAVSCQMTPMEYNALAVEVDAQCKNSTNYMFSVKAKEVVFDGYAKVAGSVLLRGDEVLQQISGIKKGDIVKCEKIAHEQKFTKPKSRYTEATLVKTLEKLGIGRPSTYATIISTVQGRGYVKKDGRYLFPTDIGLVVNDFLVEHFSDIVDYDFTSEIEQDLDNIARGEQKWVPVVDKVYKPFSRILVKKDKEVKKEDVVILGKSKFKCPECGGGMVERLGRQGKFLSCAKFPKCKGMLGLDGKKVEETLDKKVYFDPGKCEKCGGDMVVKKGKFGKFWACENYPDCKETQPLLLKKKCPDCGARLVERKGKWGKTFVGCSAYPECKYILKQPKKKKQKK
ncbi:MAG: type I DNA topoisomerase [Patescibacteria group bacterium]|nr:type I DNA topoisomerase [Patescibacteria group bacterium]